MSSTRRLKTGLRKGDHAPLALVSLTDRVEKTGALADERKSEKPKGRPKPPPEARFTLRREGLSSLFRLALPPSKPAGESGETGAEKNQGRGFRDRTGGGEEVRAEESISCWAAESIRER